MYLNDEEERYGNRFRTYANYINNLAEVLDRYDYDLNNYLNKIISTKQYKKITGGRILDERKLCKSMRNAWFTEIQINSYKEYEDFIQISAQWIPVQVYYSLFIAIRSYFNSIGSEINKDHKSTLNAISQEIKKRPDIFPIPWKIILEEDPNKTDITLTNINASYSKISKISPLSYNVLNKDSIGLFLKTTRKREIEKRKDEWKKQNKKKKTPKAVSERIIEKMSPTTIFDFLYRMRISSNYSDVDSFIVFNNNSEEINKFYNSFLKINWYGLAMLEILIIKSYGKKQFIKMAEDFTNKISNVLTKQLIDKRLEYYRKII